MNKVGFLWILMNILLCSGEISNKNVKQNVENSMKEMLKKQRELKDQERLGKKKHLGR